MKKILLGGALLLAICPSLIGIFHPGFFVSDDGNWMVIRLSAFYSALASGQFPVRFLPQLNQGIGYPVADFLYPLFLYIGSVIHIIKIPFLFDVKIILALSMIFSAVGTYIFLKRHFSSFASFFGALVYVYFPYHLYDLYRRGSVGEILSLGIVPFLFWAIEKESIFFSGLFLGLLILSHNTLALFFLPTAFLYALLKKRSVLYLPLFPLLGLGLAAFFWIPALIDKQFTVFDSTVVASPFSYFVNTISYNLVGWISLTLFAGICFLKNSFKEKHVLFFFTLGIISLFFSFPVSSLFWHSKIFAQLIQFPFRFLSLTILSAAFLSAYMVEKLHNKILVVFLFLILIFSSLPYIFPKQYNYYPDSFYATNVDTTTVHNEYMPKWITHVPRINTHSMIITSPTIVPHIIYQKGTKLSFMAHAPTATQVIIFFAYFPGWQVMVDGKIVSIYPSKDLGLIEFMLPKGTHTVQAKYHETGVDVIADCLSIVSLVVLGIFALKKS